MNEVFHPNNTVSATAGSGAAVSVQLKTSAGPGTVRLALLASTPAMYVKFGDSSVTATASDMPFLPGSVEIFQLYASETYMSVLSTGASNTMYATLGFGA